MSFTLFAMPKAFTGQFDAIQVNAIESWTRLQPRAEIILFGDDQGTAEAARKFGLRHVPEVTRNEYGTPRVDRLFADAQRLAEHDLLCYINSDIIVMPDFGKCISDVSRETEEHDFLAVGRKTSLPITDVLDFETRDWDHRLRAWAASEGRHVTYDSDFFVFRRGMWKDIPAFAIGRCYWSSWFMWDARRRGLDVIDLTAVALTVEPRHDYSHARSTGGNKRLFGVEYEANRRLFRGCRYYTTAQATKVAAPGGGLSAPPAKNIPVGFAVRLQYWLYFLLKARLYPYSLPLILLFRWALAAKRLFRTTRSDDLRTLPRLR